MKKRINLFKDLKNRFNFQVVLITLLTLVVLLLIALGLISRIVNPSIPFYDQITEDKLSTIEKENNNLFGLKRNDQLAILEIYSPSDNIDVIQNILKETAQRLDVSYSFLVENSQVIYPGGPRNEPTYTEGDSLE